MSKKKLYAIIALIGIVAVGFLVAAFLISKKSPAAPGEPVEDSFFSNFFPFGQPSGTGSGGGPEAGDGPGGALLSGGSADFREEASNALLAVQKKKLLKQLTNVPVAGFIPTTEKGAVSVRYVEKETGNIYEIKMDDLRRDRVSNTTIPQVHEAIFGDAGGSVVLRYLRSNGKTIVSYALDLRGAKPVSSTDAPPATTTNETVGGTFLLDDIKSILASKDTKALFYLSPSSDGIERAGLAFVSDAFGKGQKKVLESEFSDWTAVSFDGKISLLASKPSQKVPGFLYALDTGSGVLQKILGGINGLTALPSPNLQKILYSESNRGGFVSHIYDQKTDVTKVSPLQTLPEKCAWGGDNVTLYCGAPNILSAGDFPDAWYQGKVSFTDGLWRINTATNETAPLILAGQTEGAFLDVVLPAISTNERFLFFINKKDSTLWVYGE